MKGQIQLDQKAISDAVTTAATESDAIVAVYKAVYPNFDEIEKVGDDTQSWPACNIATWKRICAYFMELTNRLNKERRYDKQVMPAGCWMNNGFTQDDSLKDWMVKVAPVKLKEKEVEVA